jgi:hypothetical protein
MALSRACDQCGTPIPEDAAYLEVGVTVHVGDGTVSAHPGEAADLHPDCLAAYVARRVADAQPVAE